MIIRRVLVANRGEIAVRVLRTCRRLGIETVLTVSAADADSVAARLADQTIQIGSAPTAPDNPASSSAPVSSSTQASPSPPASPATQASPSPPASPATTASSSAPGSPATQASPSTTASSPVAASRPEASLADTYLSVAAVVDAASAADVDAIHPGYGFLSENPRLARACEAAGIIFIGPSADVLEAAGDKLAARRHATAAGLPVLPGGEADAAGAGVLAGRLGYPVLVKAAGGGGGRGLRVVSGPRELGDAVALASAEADAAFGDPRVYLERYVSPARHVEVQLLGDGENVIHLGDRDCSVQRRYQKVIEEAPAPRLGETLRVSIRAAAVALGLHLKYQGLGTVEFLVDTEREAFYFLEVNARIQVEHPVTEMITGLDLVAEQIAIAEGRGLRRSQASVILSGHAIECRINAEDPAGGFRPSPGTVAGAVFPAGPGIRVDTHVQTGSAIPPQYDSLLVKLIVSGADRAQALDRLRSALARCRIDGVATNTGMHVALAADREFTAGGVDTGYLARWLEQAPLPVRDMPARGDDPPDPRQESKAHG